MFPDLAGALAVAGGPGETLIPEESEYTELGGDLSVPLPFYAAKTPQR
ncbi:MAG: hypothetical protein QOC92_345 [Acidimicrobiaceae bacterium]|jgi:hypothetical protein